MAGKYWYLAERLQGAGLNVTRKVGIVDELNAALLLRSPWYQYRYFCLHKSSAAVTNSVPVA